MLWTNARKRSSGATGRGQRRGSLARRLLRQLRLRAERQRIRRRHPDPRCCGRTHEKGRLGRLVEVNGVDRSRDACYNNYDCEPSVSEYDAGTLILDVVDARTKKVVWRGWL